MDEISLNEAEDGICFYTKDAFDSSPLASLFGLRYTEDENTIEWERRKVEYTPATFLQTNFQDLLKSECENNCSFLFALHPENINKEILSGIGSAHIFVNLKPDFEQKNGLSPGYCRAEGKYVIKQMLNFDSLYMHNIFLQEATFWMQTGKE